MQPLPALPASLRRWDIFCKVVDHFGDAGVAWRLARQLTREHDLEVTLWIDQPAALAAMVPGLDSNRTMQRLAGVTVRWRDTCGAGTAPAAVVIDTFGGGLPDDYVHAMAASRSPSQWFVLEYLSAEAWIETAHGRPSPHPSLGLERTFWFPGFTAATGGLLREHDLLLRRDAFLGDADAQAMFWETLHLGPPEPSGRRVSLFCYPHAPIAMLLDQWARGAQRVDCLVPAGTAAAAIHAWLDGARWAPGTPVHRGQLTLHAIPFLTQDRYDALLWACDLNFVRGEDSFVRAQWAGKPLVWQAYPQRESAHEVKLAAFVDRYLRLPGGTSDQASCQSTPLRAGLSGSKPAPQHDAPAAIRGLWQAWNDVDGASSVGEAWERWRRFEPAIAAHARSWTHSLIGVPELGAGLVMAVRSKV